jgi:hypothetical protein
MRLLKSLFLSIAFSLFTILCSAQAIKVIFPSGFTGINSSIGLGLGYEKNLIDRLSFSIDGNWGGGAEYKQPTNFTFTKDNAEFYGNYSSDFTYFEVIYTSKYFISKNSNRSFYAGTGIGYRNCKFVTNYNEHDQYSYNSVSDVLKETHSFIPLFLKFGYRGPIDGWFVDMSFGAQYLPGVNTKSLTIPHVDNTGTGLFSTMCFTYTFAFGFGWAE